MVTQTLLEAVCAKYETWPSDDIDYFNCDFGGEVRERGDSVINDRIGTEYDFYPSIDVVHVERNPYCGQYGFMVTKDDFLKAKGVK